MNSAPAGVPCTQNSEAALPASSAISPTARLNALEPVGHGGPRTMIVPVLTIEPAVARTVVVFFEARAVSMAPAPKLSAVKHYLSAHSTIDTPRQQVSAPSAASALCPTTTAMHSKLIETM